MKPPETMQFSKVNLNGLELSAEQKLSDETIKFFQKYNVKIEKIKTEIKDEKGKREIECLLFTGPFYEIPKHDIEDFMYGKKLKANLNQFG